MNMSRDDSLSSDVATLLLVSILAWNGDRLGSCLELMLRGSRHVFRYPGGAPVIYLDD